MSSYSAAVTNKSELNNTSGSSKATNLVRFLNDPKDFSGQVIATRGDRKYVLTNSRVENNPLVWLKKLERLRDLAKLNDKELLLIAADHLVGKAEIWFDIACPLIETWNTFTTVFKKKFCTGMEDIWWSYIYNKKQSENESVEDVDIELRELYSLVGIKDEHIKVRHFMEAIHTVIAWEVERKEDISAQSSLEEVVEAATKAEAVMKKYDIKYPKNKTKRINRSEDSLSSDSEASSPISTPPKEDVSSVYSDDKMDTLLKEFNELKISMLKTQGNINPNYHRIPAPTINSYPRSQICFYCEEPGHIKTHCEKFKAYLAERQQQQTPATGANAEPINTDSGKGKGRQL